MPVRRPGYSNEPSGWQIVGVMLAFGAFVVGFICLAAWSFTSSEANNKADLKSELGFEEGVAYPAVVVGTRNIQEGISGNFFLASGSISGLDTATVVVVSVSIGDADYILYVAISDITFQQVDGVAQQTAALELRYTPSVEGDTALNHVFKEYFKSMTIVLSPEDYTRLIEELP